MAFVKFNAWNIFLNFRNFRISVNHEIQQSLGESDDPEAETTLQMHNNYTDEKKN